MNSAVYYIDINKSFGKKDISKLQKKQIINKLGRKETVYVKIEAKENKIDIKELTDKKVKEYIDYIMQQGKANHNVKRVLDNDVPDYIENSTMVNDGLRTGKFRYDSVKNIVKGFDYLFSKINPLDHDIKVYRAMEINKDFNLPNVGTIFVDKAFVSASQTYRSHEGVLENVGFYANAQNKHGKQKDSRKVISVEIIVSKGNKILPLQGKIVGRYYSYKHEKEILLDRNTKFKVVSYKDNKAVLEVL